jgi:ABC-2 type transport system permease protein
MNLGAALHAEWTKLRTAPGTAWLLFAAAALTVAVSAAVEAGAACQSGAACQPNPARLSLTGVDLGHRTPA